MTLTTFQEIKNEYKQGLMSDAIYKEFIDAVGMVASMEVRQKDSLVAGNVGRSQQAAKEITRQKNRIFKSMQYALLEGVNEFNKTATAYNLDPVLDWTLIKEMIAA